MIKRLILYCLLVLPGSVFGQDAYHSDLLTYLNENFSIEIDDYLFGNTEQANADAGYVYGNVDYTFSSVEGLNFTQVGNINVLQQGSNVWDSGFGIRNRKSFEQDDIILVSFWAKKVGSTSELFVFAEDVTTFDKEFYYPISLSPDWVQYFISFRASKNFNVDRMVMGFHLAAQVQEFEVAGFTALNLGANYDLSGVPSTFSPANYEGNEEDAPWRALAEARIENIRKADLKVSVRNQNGAPINNAIVSSEMIEHEFGFGSAIVSCRIPNNQCYDATYVSKLMDLDGKGHQFNVGVTENALKWRAWEAEWLGPPEDAIKALEWLTEQGITMRGHNLFWPGSDYLPDDINENLNDLEYLRSRIDARIETLIENPQIKSLIRDWDILNEIAVNRTFESAFKNDPNFETGREIYVEMIEKVRAFDPTLELYINDYVVLSGGGSSDEVINRYKQFLDELSESAFTFDGIGFQGHIGSFPTSIPKTLQVFDEFYQRYDVPFQLTEYDINPNIDEQTQAKYLEDFLTACFSHPAMKAFLMWGFWDGNHWKGNAPLFDIDWNLKPSGESFFKKVFDDWWTVESGATNEAGEWSVRAFKGKHLVRVEYNGETIEMEVDLTENEEIVFDFSTTGINDSIFENLITVSPMPFNDSFTLNVKGIDHSYQVQVFDLNGKICHSKFIENGQQILPDLSPGNYFLKVIDGNKVGYKKIITVR